jgi:hypothetical protein
MIHKGVYLPETIEIVEALNADMSERPRNLVAVAEPQRNSMVLQGIQPTIPHFTR